MRAVRAVTVALLWGLTSGHSPTGSVERAWIAPIPKVRPGQEVLAEQLRLLDRADPATFAGALARLNEIGAAAGVRAMRGFADLRVAARRARARLLADLASREVLQDVLALMADPDPEVRRLLVGYLGDLGLAEASAEARLLVLTQHAAQDPDPRVRRASLAAMSAARLPGTAEALDALIDRVGDREAAQVAEALAGLGRAGGVVASRVQAAFAPGREGKPPIEDDVLVPLLKEYGRALAELPNGGLAARERAPIVLGVLHPDLEVQRAAWAALQSGLARLIELGELERAEQFLAALGAEGLPSYDLLYRRVGLALSGRGKPEQALELARALEHAAELAPREDAPTYRYYALHFQGASLFALGRPADGRERFAAAARHALDLLGERLDLRQPGAGAQRSRGGGIMVERLQLVALLEVWQAACLLAEGVPPEDARVLEFCRSAHEGLLRAQVMDHRTDARTDPRSFDTLLDRDLAPGPLVLYNRKIANWSGEQAYGLLDNLGRALATVAPQEMPGFEPLALEDGPLTDPILDPARFALYRSNREELINQIVRDLGFANGPQEELGLRRLRAYFRDQIQRESIALAEAGGDRLRLTRAKRLELFHELLGLRLPSLFAFSLGQNLRQAGHSEEARALGSRLLSDLGRHLPGTSDIWTEWASAQVELMIGSAWMDADRPLEAESVSLSAVRRLEEIETTIEVQNGGGLDAASRTFLEQLRALRGNALLSLAVNANVRMGDTERALAYFERAFELDQRDFMQVLYACYRARSGRRSEARSVLAAVRPAPPLYYNLACTYALLGEVELALDFLQRELEENHPSPAALARQRSWALADPDLASLRDHPRFQALVAQNP